LFGFGDPKPAAVLQGKEDGWLPATDGLGDLYICLADVVAGALKIRLCLQEKRTWFYKRLARVLVLEVLEKEGRVIMCVVRGVKCMAGVIVQLKFLGGEGGYSHQGEGEKEQAFHDVFDKCPMGREGGAELWRNSHGSPRKSVGIGTFGWLIMYYE